MKTPTSIVNSDTEAVALHWFYLWADCIRLRKAIGMVDGGDLYTGGAPGSGEYQPSDDPHPMMFVFVQVERLLAEGPTGIRAFAEHLFVRKSPPYTFRHPSIRGTSRAGMYRIRQGLLGRLAITIFLEIPEALTEEGIREARARNLEERRTR